MTSRRLAVWALVAALAILGLLISFAADGQTTYNVQMVPVSWSDIVAPIDSAASLRVCTDAAPIWDAMSKGRVLMTCMADTVHVLPTKFDGDCLGDWTGAINASGGNGNWPFYVHGAPCGYHANLGRRGGWLLGGGQLVHEFGHNLGLNHTAEVRCYASQPFDPTPGAAATCSFTEYAQGFDIMGTGSGLIAAHRLDLNVPPHPVALLREDQTVDVGTVSASMTRGDGGLEFWMEYLPGPNQIIVSYTGWPMPTNATDVVICARLAPGDSFKDINGGNTITRPGAGTTVNISTVPPRTPTPTVISPTAIPPTPGGCWFGFTQISCTPTSAPTTTPTPTTTVVPFTGVPTVTPTVPPLGPTLAPTAPPEPRATPIPTSGPPPTTTVPERVSIFAAIGAGFLWIGRKLRNLFRRKK